MTPNKKNHIPPQICILTNFKSNRLRRMANWYRKNSHKMHFTSFDRFHPLLDRVSGFKKTPQLSKLLGEEKRASHKAVTRPELLLAQARCFYSTSSFFFFQNSNSAALPSLIKSASFLAHVNESRKKWCWQTRPDLPAMPFSASAVCQWQSASARPFSFLSQSELADQDAEHLHITRS